MAANQNQNKKKGKSKMKSSVYKATMNCRCSTCDLVAKTLGIVRPVHMNSCTKRFSTCTSTVAWWFRKESSSSGWRSTRRAVTAHEKNKTSRWLGACEKLLPVPSTSSISICPVDQSLSTSSCCVMQTEGLASVIQALRLWLKIFTTAETPSQAMSDCWRNADSSSRSILKSSQRTASRKMEICSTR